MNKILVITGGSRGIGFKTIQRFLQEEYQVINISRTPCKLANVTNLNIDLTQVDDIEAHKEKLQSLLDDASEICLVHNAAFYPADKIGSIEREVFSDVLAVQLVAPVILNNIVIPKMNRGSSIIYIGSTLSEMAIENHASYVISKHAIIGMMRSTCQDLAPLGIHTACICPGIVNTEMTVNENVDHEKLHAFLKTKVIAKRFIEPEEIAEFVYFAATMPVVNGALYHANLGHLTS